MREWLYDVFRERPWWMSAAMIFCAFMAFIYMPWDIFIKPMAHDEEVWFGILFTGFWAKVLAFPHWFVYGAAVYGFRRRRPWMAFWGPAYVAQVAFGMWLWTAMAQGGFTGAILGVIPAAPFAGLTYAFWKHRDYFEVRNLRLTTRYGNWALVTGASAGIGQAIARQVAADGMNVALTARREERLTNLAAEIERDFAIETRIITADLAERSDVEALLSAVSDLEIGLLVNNAGLGYAGPPMVLTHALVQGMRERGRGGVVFTGSAAGRQPLPLHGVYAATKAFDLFLGEALWAELRASNIDVVVLEPGSTETEFQEVAGELAHPGQSPEEVARRGLMALGEQPSVMTGWFNWIRAQFASRLLTRPISAHVAYSVMAKQTPEDLR
jgi:short-subunit dehydrogenase